MRSFRRSVLLAVVFLLSPTLLLGLPGHGSLASAVQILFERAAEQALGESPVELNGYVRGTFYLGKTPGSQGTELKSGYGEGALKLRVRLERFGDAFAEVRFRNGYEFGSSLSEITLREAYVNAYVGPLDFRVGHQIVVWGRADGINPTDNITPKNMLARSPEEDDRREANFLIRAACHVHPLRFEAIWIPTYRSSYIPVDLFPYPSGVTLGEPDYPGPALKNSAFAFRANLELASFDGSVSYFNGHNPFPGISAEVKALAFPDFSLKVFPKSYRMHVLGLDFQSVLWGKLGLRAEAAYRRPHRDYRSHVHIPHPDLQLVLGAEREFPGNFTLLLEYVGRYVFDFYELARPRTLSEVPLYELEQKNRLVNSQQYAWSHSLFCRASWVLLHETLNLEILAMANLTTDEVLFRPRLSYDLADNLDITVGIELLSGPEDTLFGTIDSTLNAFFGQVKASF